MCRVAAVKLGGGAITFKSAPESVDEDSLQAIAAAIASYRLSGGTVALVHGGGSFGHYAVSRILSERGSLLAADASPVQLSMLRLSLRVLQALLSQGLRPTLHPPHSLCYTADPKSCSFEPLKRDLAAGLVPVSYGDAIPEGKLTRIISGDDLLVEMASAIGADCVLFVIREEGVLDEEGKLMKTVSSLEGVKVIKKEGFDVTGGIAKKVESALRAAERARNVRIVGAGLLQRALMGEDVGTRVKA